MNRETLRDRVCAAMGDQREEMEVAWGDRIGSLVDYLAVTTAPREVGLDLLRQSIERMPRCSTLVLSGERCSGDESDGSDSPILTGLVPIMEMLAPVSATISVERNGREPDALYLYLSGGVRVTPEMGELPVDQMARQFNVLTSNRFAPIVGIDTMSLNTGDQARALAGIAYGRRTKRIVVGHVCDHVARFAATIACGLQEMVDAENARLEAMTAVRRQRVERGEMPDDHPIFAKLRASRREMPEIICVAFGDWEDRDPRRGRDDGLGIARRREGFGPIQADAEVMYPKKYLGGEYGPKRLLVEQDEEMSLGYACRALPPERMLQLLSPEARALLAA